MGTLANSEYSDEMPYYHPGQYCLPRQEKNQYFFRKSSINILNYPDITVLNFMENAIGLKRIKKYLQFSLLHHS